MGAVVRLVGQDPELGQLAVPDLVRDLARLHVPLGIVGRGLEPRQAAQCAGRELGEAADAVHGHDQRIPPEQGHEPRHPGRRDEHAALEGRVLQAQRLEVVDGLVPGPPDGGVRRVERHRGQSPARRIWLGRGEGVAAEGRRSTLRVGHRQPAQAGMPHVLGRERGHEDEPPVRELGRGVGLVDGDDQLAPEVAVLVRRAQLATAPEPARMERSASHEGVVLDVEQVREVGCDLDLDRQAHRPATVVDDVVVLVDPAGHGSIEPKREAVSVDWAELVDQSIGGELVARRIELDRRRVEEERPLPVDVQLVAGHETGVAGEEALLGSGLDPGVRLAHEDTVVTVDRHRRRTDLDRERHGSHDRVSRHDEKQVGDRRPTCHRGRRRARGADRGAARPGIRGNRRASDQWHPRGASAHPPTPRRRHPPRPDRGAPAEPVRGSPGGAGGPRASTRVALGPDR